MRAIHCFQKSLGSRGWAVIVLAAGCILAIPFFKVNTQPKSPSHSGRPGASDSSTLQASKATLPTGARAANSTLPSSKPILDQAEGTTAGRPSQIKIDVGRLVELNSGVDRNTSEQIADPRDKQAAQSDSIYLVQPAHQTQERTVPGAEPIKTELPAWAKKSSLLDYLVTSTANEKEAVGADVNQGLQARRPSPFRAWTPDQTERGSLELVDGAFDRYSPFREMSEQPLMQLMPKKSSTSWPDEDPRTAVALESVQRLVGRDAIIRDPEKLDSVPEQLGRIVARPGGSNGDMHEEQVVIPASTITQPKFGQPHTADAGSKAPIGAALRSRIPPDDQLFISQPKH